MRRTYYFSVLLTEDDSHNRLYPIMSSVHQYSIPNLNQSLWKWLIFKVDWIFSLRGKNCNLMQIMASKLDFSDFLHLEHCKWQIDPECDCIFLFQVDAYPAAVTFSWYFNNSEHKESINEERFSTNGLVSTLNFAPTTNQDYGTLYCLGENAVGHQDEPCAFKIVPTGIFPFRFLRYRMKIGKLRT